ncbi:MAG: hypothetical protein JSW53_05865 [Candidatus Bathyarchaeota archaeon]|nr:MAG: hypothetical protein JSW53_05865 [Candidatus Bathyarchaeota archaeon]
METRKTSTLKDYIAGAVLANSLAWLTLAIALPPVQLLFLTYVFGAIVAGYLVARKASQNHERVGLKAGLGSFVFHIYVFMGVIEVITGQRLLNLLDHLIILVIFVLGGFVGAFLSKQLSSRKAETP